MMWLFNQSNQRDNQALLGVDILRHILIIAVIFQHMLSPSRYSDDVNQYIISITTFIDGAVAGFFLLSGYFSKQTDPAVCVRKQSRRLLIPYMIFCIINATLLILFDKLSAGQTPSTLFHGGGIGPQLYFLLYLFAISIFFSTVEHRFGRPGILVMLALCFAAFVFLPTSSSTGPDLRLVPLYALTYGLGIWLTRYSKESERLILILATVLAFVFTPPATRFWDLELVILLLALALLVSCFDLARIRLPGSGGVYLLHTPVLNFALSTAFMRFGIAGIINIWLSLATTYAVSLLLTLAVIRVAPRYRAFLLE